MEAVASERGKRMRASCKSWGKTTIIFMEALKRQEELFAPFEGASSYHVLWAWLVIPRELSGGVTSHDVEI
jgi:hypothetical protein